MVTFIFLNLPVGIDEDILKRELENQIGALPTLDSIRILRERNGTSKGIALIQVDVANYSAVTGIENTVIYICGKKISIRRKDEQIALSCGALMTFLGMPQADMPTLAGIDELVLGLNN